MSKTAGAGLGNQAGVGVVDDVLKHLVEVAEDRHGTAVDQVADLPGHDMIGAGRVSGNADGAGLVAVDVKGEPASKDIHAPDADSDQGIVLGAEAGRVSFVGLDIIYRIALLEYEQASARLHGGVEVGG